jgi:ubiquinone/menaquinone biosynthesis C-methylase UbiE
MFQSLQSFRIWSVAILVAAFLPVSVTGVIGDEADRPSQEARLTREILETTGAKGGLIVHVGCGDGKLTAALRTSDRYLVHGLDADPEKVALARKHIHSLGPYGQVSVDRLDGTKLPYVDNLVNLVVVEELGKTPMEEVLRVLSPDGVAYVRQNGE